MYRRRKILLALLEAFDGQLDRLRLQKLLFLLCRTIDPPPYFFLPYTSGCFSFQANMDLLTLEKKGVVKRTPERFDLGDDRWSDRIGSNEQKRIQDVKRKFGPFTDEELIRHTYVNYPFFAVNSTIAHEYLNPAEMNLVRDSIPTETAPVLMTLGYEGLSIEQYMSILVEHSVRLLCDVRKNAMSMKYGFSKKTLATACESVGIEYVHVPEVGIVSDKRRNLHSRADYEQLFAEYRAIVLKETPDVQQGLAQRIETARRAALLCYEKDPSMCHRSHLASALRNRLPSSFRIEHANA